MRLGSVLLGSVALHGGVLALLVQWIPAAEELAPPPRPLVEITIEPPIAKVEPHPIEVAMIDLKDEPPPVASTARIAATDRHERHEQATDHAAASSIASPPEAATAATAPEHTSGSDMFHHMRAPDLRPAEGVMQHIAEAGGHDAPDRPRATGRVDSAPNGTAVIHDATTTVHVDRDGNVHLHDEPEISAEWRLPIHPDVVGDVKAFGRMVTNWYVDPQAGTRFGRTQDLPQHLQAVEGGCNTYGDVMCDDANAPAAEKNARETGGGGGLPILGGKLDVTGYLMRKLHVGDAYASRKLKLLDDTRDERAARGAEHRAEQLARSAELMRTSLARLWANKPPPTRKNAARSCSSCGMTAPKVTDRSVRQDNAHERR